MLLGARSALAAGEPLSVVLVHAVGDVPLPVATWRAGRLVQQRGQRPAGSARAASSSVVATVR